MELTREQVKEWLSNQSVMEIAALTKELEEEWGVSAAPAVAAIAAAPGAGGGEAAAEEPTEFNVILAEIGSEKIKVIKVVREVTGLGLKEAKEVVDGAPKPVKESISKEEAAEIVKKFEEVGAKMEVKAA